MQDRMRAWLLAHKILSVIDIIHDREDADMLEISTEEIRRSMGETERVELERIREFVYHVIEFLGGYGLNIVCGCGYISIKVMRKSRFDELADCTREITQYAPDDLDEYFVTYVLKKEVKNTDVEATCDIGEIRKKVREV